MKINEIFFSLQGEGVRQGRPSIFIRLTGCDMTCGYCDTEFESGVEKTPQQLLEMIQDRAAFSPYNNVQCKEIVWTGGEPSLQLTSETVLFFKKAGYYQSIETNGNHLVPMEVDLISLSPKVAEHVIAKNFAFFTFHNPALFVDKDSKPVLFNPNEPPCPKLEVRYVRHKGQLALPTPAVKADYYYISPMFDGNNINKENLNHCIKLIQENSSSIPWTLSVQLHKLIKVL